MTSLKFTTQKVAYDSFYEFVNINCNMQAYGKLQFTDKINLIPAATFNFIANLTSDAQSQIYSITSNISANYVDKTSNQRYGITGTKNFSTLIASNAIAD